MKYWCIEPRDTALFRDARPFEAGAPAKTLSFPLPSTTAGFVRSRLGMSAQGEFELTPAKAREIRVAGPWLAEMNPHTGELSDYLFTAPRDAVFFADEEKGRTSNLLQRRRLIPRAPSEDEWTDLPDGMQLVSFAQDFTESPGKPTSGPSMWSRHHFQDWLDTPSTAHSIKGVDPGTLGLRALPRQRRIHVKINSETQTADDGFLFQTEQLSFTLREGRETRRFGFVVRTDDDIDVGRMLAGPDSFGGERRISFVKPADLDMLTCPDLGGDELVRVILLTPAIFKDGWKPGADVLGDGAELIAACVSRYEPISGWSFEHCGPKPSRRLAPAGSVYWLRVPGGASQWANSHHLTCLSDDPQDRLDGFGLIAIGRA